MVYCGFLLWISFVFSLSFGPCSPGHGWGFCTRIPLWGLACSFLSTYSERGFDSDDWLWPRMWLHRIPIRMVAFNNYKSKEANLVIQTVRYWLERLVKNVRRYHYEYDDCIWSINKYIDSNTTVLGSCLLPMKEIISSLQTFRSYWANCYHKHTPLMPTIQQNHTLSQWTGLLREWKN